MESPKARSTLEALEEWGDQLRQQMQDLPTRWALAAFGGVVVLHLLPISRSMARGLDEFLAPGLFQALVLLALLLDLNDVEEPLERRFWLDLAAAHGAWLLATCVRMLPSSAASALAVDGLYFVYYLGLILAIERRAHRVDRWRPTRLERALVWPGATLFLLGLWVYLVLIPGGVGALYIDRFPSYLLYVSLDAYVASTFLYLARTCPAPRWSSLYRGLGLGYALVLLSDVLEAGLYQYLAQNIWGSSLDLLWNLPPVVLVWAIRRRHRRFPSLDAEAVTRARAEEDLSDPSGRTMVTALTIPFLHLAVYRFLGFSEDPVAQWVRELREITVLLWMALLASVAALQHRLLRKRLERLNQEREDYEASLKSSEKDLRIMLERQHGEQQLRENEQRFTKAFHANPDPMSLSTWEDGRILDINTTFEELSGFSRDDLVGKLSTEIGMWGAPSRSWMLDLLETDGRIRDLETDVPLPSGRRHRSLVSVEPLDIDGESCLLAVFRPLFDRPEEES